jgi:two-component system nitrate/nitrite response regulator NarL
MHAVPVVCKLLLYCEHPILSVGFQSIVEGEGDFDCTVTTSKEEVVNRMRVEPPDLLLLDLTSEFRLRFLEEITKIGSVCKIVLWVDFISTETAYQAFSMGVRGIIQKVVLPETFLMHLRSIREGNLWIEKGLMNSIASAKTVSLTRREAQLVSLLAQALKNKEIAATLNVTENTVKAYMSRLFQKLGVKDRLELALYGLKNLNGCHNWALGEQGRVISEATTKDKASSFQSLLMQSHLKSNVSYQQQNTSRL